MRIGINREGGSNMEIMMISGVLALLSGGTVFLAQQMRTRPTR